MMKPFHYHEIQNLKDLPMYERANELFGGWASVPIIGLYIFIIVGILMTIISLIGIAKPKRDKDLKKIFKELLLINFFTVAIASTVFAFIHPFITAYESIGNYEAKAKVKNVDKTEKVEGEKQYVIDVRLMEGQTEYKKGDPLKIKSAQKFKNGDIVKIKTPELKFKENKKKDVAYGELIKNGTLSDNPVFYKVNVPKKVGVDELRISKS